MEPACRIQGRGDGRRSAAFRDFMGLFASIGRGCRLRSSLHYGDYAGVGTSRIFEEQLTLPSSVSGLSVAGRVTVSVSQNDPPLLTAGCACALQGSHNRFQGGVVARIGHEAGHYTTALATDQHRHRTERNHLCRLATEQQSRDSPPAM